MMVSRGLADGPTGIEVRWTFLDDGELLATGGANPYFPEQFHRNPAAMAEYEAEVAALEQQGYAVTTVSKYVDAVRPQLAPAEAPPLLDGTWQPGSTNGIHKWLGGKGIWIGAERDNDVRTLLWLAHRELVAAEVIARQAKLDAAARVDAGSACWRWARCRTPAASTRSAARWSTASPTPPRRCA